MLLIFFFISFDPYYILNIYCLLYSKYLARKAFLYTTIYQTLHPREARSEVSGHTHREL